jgi:RNA polymerase sigma-70 factor (ECF subfamily)
LTREEFKNLFDQHYDAVRNYIYYRSGDADMATDIAQDAFLTLWEKQLGDGHANAKALVFRIAGNLFISHYRRQRKLTGIKLSLNPDVSTSSPDEQVMFSELKEKYERALLKMPEKQRIVFLMSRIDRMKYHEIAERLGLSQKAVEKRMSLAIRFLKEKMEVE